MSYVQKILQPGEHLAAVGRLHWIIYKDAVIALVLSLVLLWIAAVPTLGSGTASMTRLGGLTLATAAAWLGIKAWFDQWITEIAVTDRRVIYKRGFIKRFTAEMNMDKIESVAVTQSILGRLLDYGTIHVRGTGDGLEHLHRIRSPIALRNCIIAR